MGNRRFGSDKETEKIIRKARAAGWEVAMTKGNHIRFLSPNGKDMVIGGLTSNTSGVLQLRRRLKMAGLTV